jgi:hypothetical protein
MYCCFCLVHTTVVGYNAALLTSPASYVTKPMASGPHRMGLVRAQGGGTHLQHIRQGTPRVSGSTPNLPTEPPNWALASPQQPPNHRAAPPPRWWIPGSCAAAASQDTALLPYCVVTIEEDAEDGTHVAHAHRTIPAASASPAWRQRLPVLSASSELAYLSFRVGAACHVGAARVLRGDEPALRFWADLLPAYRWGHMQHQSGVCMKLP